jgi:hypothetical protein
MKDADHDAAEDAFPAPLAQLVVAERHRQGPARHAAAETLTAYHAGTLGDAEAESLRDHLAVCPHCARLLLDLAAFVDTPLGAADAGADPRAAGHAGADASSPASADAPADAGWEALRRRLPPPPAAGAPATGAPATGVPTVVAPPVVAPPVVAPAAALRPRPSAYLPPTRRGLLLAAAALLAAILVGGGWFLGARSSGPATARYAVVQLVAADVLRSGTGDALPPTTLHADLGVTLVLHLARPQPDLRAGVEVRGAAGPGDSGGNPGNSGSPAKPWRALDLAVVMPTPQVAVLVLAPRVLAPGAQDLRLVDPAHPEADPLGVYPLSVVSP